MAAPTEEIVLIDAETNKQFKIIISKEEAAKARNDLTFAYSLLEAARKDAGPNSQHHEAEQRQKETHPDQNTSTTEQHMWSRAETLSLISLYADNKSVLDNPKVTAKNFWKMISKKMEDASYFIDATKCTTKFQCLKRTYKSVLDHNRKSGNDRRNWEYFEAMHEIFSSQPWVQPVATAGSSVDSNVQEKATSSEPVPRKRKIDSVIEDYVEKSLNLTIQREEALQQRHKEKMQHLLDIKKLLGDILTK